MNIEITEQQFEILKRLVDGHIQELHPEIRRSRTYTVRDDLQAELTAALDLQERLQSASSQASP